MVCPSGGGGAYIPVLAFRLRIPPAPWPWLWWRMEELLVTVGSTAAQQGRNISVYHAMEGRQRCVKAEETYVRLCDMVRLPIKKNAIRVDLEENM